MCRFRLDYVLYIGRTEVTWGQFMALIRPLPPPLIRDKSDAPYPAYVSWAYAKAFCGAYEDPLEKHFEGDWQCRLPREAEWEYAACYDRPPNTEWLPTKKELAACAWPRLDLEAPRPVARKQPTNSLGLYDIFGNQEEWCEGWLTDSVTEMLRDAWKPGLGEYSHPWRGDETRVASTDDPDYRPTVRRGWGTNVGSGFRIVILPLDRMGLPLRSRKQEGNAESAKPPKSRRPGQRARGRPLEYELTKSPGRRA